MKKKLMALCAALIMAVTVLTPVTVLAWDANTEVTDEDQKQKVKGESTDTGDSKEGTIGINGVIKKFNTDVEPGPDDPEYPPAVWLNVSIPKKLYFASTNLDNKNIFGSKHRIVNHSPFSVEIYTKSLTIDDSAQHIDNYDLNLSIKEIDNDTNTLVTTPKNCTVAVSSLVLFENTSTTSKVTPDVLLATLFDGTSENDGKNLEGKAPEFNKGAVIVQLNGTLPSAWDYSVAKKPSYTLVLKFKTGENKRGIIS